jgi:hypothetical protein
MSIMMRTGAELSFPCNTPKRLAAGSVISAKRSFTPRVKAWACRILPMICWLRTLGQYRKQNLIDRYGADIRLPGLREEIAQCRAGCTIAYLVRYIDLVPTRAAQSLSFDKV